MGGGLMLEGWEGGLGEEGAGIESYAAFKVPFEIME